MKHIFLAGEKEAPVLILLHGTGGDEQSLLEVGHRIDEKAAILSIRGNVLENGMPRFFRRLQEGVYDEKDLAERGTELEQFIQSASQKYQFSRERMVLVGYSNGANMAVRLMLENPELFTRAILFHPMYPVKNLPQRFMQQVKVLMSFGKQDPIVSVAQSHYLYDLFTERQAEIETIWTQSHQLTLAEVEKAKVWLAATEKIKAAEKTTVRCKSDGLFFIKFFHRPQRS